MGAYTARRLLAIIPTIFLISLFVFFIMRIMPGDVAYLLLGGPDSNQAFSEEELNEVRDRLGLNDSLPVQYVHWLEDLVLHKGGNSLFSGEPVYDELARRLPLTVQLAIYSILVAHLIAIPAGIFSALRRNSVMDHGVRLFAITGLAIPNFWQGILIILLLVRVFDYSIPLSYANPFEDPWRNFQQLIFPTLVLGTALAASVARLTRASMLESLREDYVRTAHAKGLQGRAVVLRHVLRNSILPVMTLSALQMGALLSGTVVTERVFALPGVGRYIVDAIFQRDYIIVQTIVLLFGIVYMLINLATDLAYAVVDPRIRYK
jgi:peptide/nickel transport system permease protein